MADREVTHLLIGGGIACATAAQTLRENGAEGSILVVGRELDPPYHRPPISKGYLRGTDAREDTFAQAPGWYPAHDVELLTRTSVMALDAAARTVKLSTKEEVGFQSCLLATGAMVRRLTVEGATLEGIHYLRTLGNADALRRDAEQAEHVVIVGGSYIACEVAATLTAQGHDCTMVMLEEVTLERGFGPEAGRFFHDTLVEHGVSVIGPDEVARFEGDGTGEGARVTRVITAGGSTLPADLVVAGVGAQPDVMLARRAGLPLGALGGVSTDSRLRVAGSAVYAAGDMAEYESVIHGRSMRIEHEDVAAAQGRTAARNMLGADVPHATVPYFFSDLADWTSLEYVGPAGTWDEEVVRGDRAAGRFSHWYLHQGRVVAMLTVGRGEELDAARALIGSRRELSAAERAVLGEPGSDLQALTASGG